MFSANRPQYNQSCLFVQLKLFFALFFPMACDCFQIDKESHVFHSNPSAFLFCFQEAKTDTLGGAVSVFTVYVCASTSSVCMCVRLVKAVSSSLSCSGPQPGVEQQPFIPCNKHTEHLFSTP